ncbi:MAG: hypothetical protein WD872_16665 [Pirellulaceae bacterium]
MQNALLERIDFAGSDLMLTDARGQMVDAVAFRQLLVSHRRMERVACDQVRLRALRDLDTGEVFLTDERRLFDPRR